MTENILSEIKKRISIRFPFVVPLEWSFQNSSLKVLAQSDNMSLHGMLVLSPVPYPDYNKVADANKVADTNNQSSIVIHILGSSPDIVGLPPLYGRVVWMRQEKSSPTLNYSLGVEFQNPEQKVLLLLVEYAIVQLTNKIEKNPDDLWLYRFRGDVKKAKGDIYGAVEDYTKAEKLKKY